MKTLTELQVKDTRKKEAAKRIDCDLTALSCLHVDLYAVPATEQSVKTRVF